MNSRTIYFGVYTINLNSPNDQRLGFMTKTPPINERVFVGFYGGF
ncbi:hypothetical protein N44_01865 [Microcystis aeruginosa NIES-44]|uniref:Uncharacterized protein n=1 Tax=Microcystis aeruginosa NIES-44 TaxID=449439 RepID=A0A0A1VUJ6_MICAE|nr:hypothetical protein N44_01865 [Microcystis aeruginosa NIES-44]